MSRQWVNAERRWKGKQSMRYLRKVRGLLLAGSAWGLVMFCWLLPVPSQATVPQAPNQNTNLTLTVGGNSNVVTLTGRLTSGGKPIAGAQISLAIDARVVQQATTGGDGSYSASVGVPAQGDHLASATYGGDGTYRGAAATDRFTVKTDAPTAPPAPTTVIAATLSPSPIHAGGVLGVTGKLTSNGAPIDAARVDFLCDFGGATAMSATDAAGAFTTTLALPATGQPASLTVTISYAGDSRFGAANGTFKVQVLPPATPSAVPSPIIAPVSSLPPISQVTATHETVASSSARRDSATPASTAGLFLAAVALYAFSSLCVVWFLAWSRHELLPGERRGFGSDFGRRRSA
jgi:hypothetical protein